MSDNKKKQDAWNKFLDSGKINDYLNYRMEQTTATDDTKEYMGEIPEQSKTMG